MSVPEPGQRICNRYVLLEHIGTGGHGEIWSATDDNDGQKVALKFLREDLASSVEAWAVLNHESQMARRLNHPGILRSGTPIRDGERTVLPMEYAGGGDLKRLRGQSYLRSVPVLIRIGEILAHAHARGVVHRDLKPGNVLFDEQGSVRLADFGASGLSGSMNAHAQGSPYTASPQQLQDLPAAPSDDIYGLGALAYELLSGYPPYYPQVTPERVLREPVPELQPAQPAPARLVALIMRMLEKEPDQRPANMAQVIEGLNQALSDTLIVDDTEPAIVPEPQAIPGMDDLRADRRMPADPRLLPAAGWLGAAGVLGAVIVALLVLRPWRADPPADAPPSAAPPVAAEGPAAPAPAAAPPDATAAERHDALLAQLEARDAALWAGPEFARAKETGEAAHRSRKAGRDEEAAAGFARAATALAAIEERRPAALAAALAAGRTALASNQDALARQAFQRALRIDPQSAEAAQGVAQADRLRDALAQLAAGVQAEAAGDEAAAGRAYGEALRLVPGLEAAARAQERLGGGRSATEFGRQVARGFERLRAGQFTDARRAFERGLQLQPGNATALDGIAQVDAALAAADYEGLRREGASLEAQERWHEARDAYRRALEKDASLRFAQQGAERAGTRAELSDRLDGYLQQPSRLGSAAVRREASQWLEQARSLDGGPVLRSQVDRVELLLRDYDRPVDVAVVSDGATVVTILRVGELGRFAERSVSLPPGEYTFVGTRVGYRDVRRDIQILPGGPPPVIRVSCTEPIG